MDTLKSQLKAPPLHPAFKPPRLYPVGPSNWKQKCYSGYTPFSSAYRPIFMKTSPPPPQKKKKYGIPLYM